MGAHDIENKVRELRQLQALIEEAQQEAETIRAELKFLMGSQEEIRAGEYKITWKPVTSARIDTAALKKAMPEVAQAFTRETTNRRLCIV